MLARRSIQAGMIVRGASRSRLGVVTGCANVHFYLRKGLLNPERYAALYSEIADLVGGEIILRRGTESLIDPSKATPEGPVAHTKPIYSLPAGSAQS